MANLTDTYIFIGRLSDIVLIDPFERRKDNEDMILTAERSFMIIEPQSMFTTAGRTLLSLMSLGKDELHIIDGYTPELVRYKVKPYITKLSEHHLFPDPESCVYYHHATTDEARKDHIIAVKETHKNKAIIELSDSNWLETNFPDMYQTMERTVAYVKQDADMTDETTIDPDESGEGNSTILQ